MEQALDRFESDRTFQLWHYTVSHSQLLLRSPPGSSHSTRIDILFKCVDRMDVPTSMDGLRIHRSGPQYLLRGKKWSGSVTASVAFAAEDDGDYADPSLLFIDGL